MNLSWIVKGGQAYKTYDILQSTWAVPHGFSWDVLNNANALVPSCLPVFNSVWPGFLADLSNFHTLTSSAISSAIKLGHKIQIDSQLDIPSGKLTWPMRKPSFLIRDTSSIIFHFPFTLPECFLYLQPPPKKNEVFWAAKIPRAKCTLTARARATTSFTRRTQTLRGKSRSSCTKSSEGNLNAGTVPKDRPFWRSGFFLGGGSGGENV